MTTLYLTKMLIGFLPHEILVSQVAEIVVHPVAIVVLMLPYGSQGAWQELIADCLKIILKKKRIYVSRVNPRRTANQLKSHKSCYSISNPTPVLFRFCLFPGLIGCQLFFCFRLSFYKRMLRIYFLISGHFMGSFGMLNPRFRGFRMLVLLLISV